MSRADTTAMLSKLVEKRLRNQTAFWASEVSFDRNTPDERQAKSSGQWSKRTERGRIEHHA